MDVALHWSGLAGCCGLLEGQLRWKDTYSETMMGGNVRRAALPRTLGSAAFYKFLRRVMLFAWLSMTRGRRLTLDRCRRRRRWRTDVFALDRRRRRRRRRTDIPTVNGLPS